MKRCPECGKEYSDEVTACPTDGQPVTETTTSLPARSVLSIVLFAILSTFTGMGAGWIVVAIIEGHVIGASGATRANAIDTIVVRSIPVIIAGGILGFIAGAIGKYVSEKHKLVAQSGVALGGHSIMRLNALIQTFMPVAFALGFVVFGVVGFIRVGNAQQQFESKLQSIQAGKIQPDTLTVVRKYANPGRHGDWPHVIFSSNRQQKVNISVTAEFFNTVNPGDVVPGYYFPDGYFIPESQGKNTPIAKWVFLCFGILSGGGITAFGLARAKAKLPYTEMVAVRG